MIGSYDTQGAHGQTVLLDGEFLDAVDRFKVDRAIGSVRKQGRVLIEAAE